MIETIVTYSILILSIFFIVIYGIISFAKYIDDKRINSCSLLDAICSIVVIILIVLLLIFGEKI